MTNPQSIAGDIQLVSGVVVTGCLYASVTAEGGGFGLPLCAVATTAYAAAVAYQAWNAESTHETVVILGTVGISLFPLGRIGEVIGDALAPLAAPGIAEAPGNKEKQVPHPGRLAPPMAIR